MKSSVGSLFEKQLNCWQLIVIILIMIIVIKRIQVQGRYNN